MFFDFQFRSLCGIARIPYAAGGLEQQVVELPPQNYSVAKILKTARLQGPVSGCQNQPKTGYVRRYLQGPELKIPGCVKDSCAYPRTQF